MNKGESKYDPLPSALSASAKPPNPGTDPVAALLKSVLSPSQDSKYNPLSQASQSAEEGIPLEPIPSPIAALLTTLRSRSQDSKYNPFREAGATAHAQPLDPDSDPVAALLNAVLSPVRENKYNPLSQASRSAEAGGSRVTPPNPVAALLGAISSRPQESKYNPFREADVPAEAASLDPRTDPIVGLLKAALSPPQKSKYDPFKDLLEAIPDLPEPAKQDLREALPRRGDSKYDPLPGVLAADRQATPSGRLDILRGLLKADQPSSPSKFDPLHQAKHGIPPREARRSPKVSESAADKGKERQSAESAVRPVRPATSVQKPSSTGLTSTEQWAGARSHQVSMSEFPYEKVLASMAFLQEADVVSVSFPEVTPLR